MSLETVESIPALPRRQPGAHKGDYGTVLVVAGGRGMAGAAALVGAGALRSGAGRVRVACPAEVQPTVAQFEPCYMAYPLPDDGQGHIAYPACQDELASLAESSTVLAAGPGLGRSDGLRGMVQWLLGLEKHPVVLDADALNNLVGQTDRLKKNGSRTRILTPHPGEFARLIGRTTAEVQADRQTLAADFAAAYGVVLVLKGHGTIVTDGRRLYVNRTGNPGMATGGTGDVLTGVIAALLGQGLDPFEAAQLGVYAHGLAGDIARDQNGEVGMIAGDVVDALPDAFDHLGALQGGED
jgi:ADP-dependent NAD(P)H-hydrate dehydratase